MELEDFFKNKSDEEISAFAFKIGKLLDAHVRAYKNNLVDTNRNLEAKIMSFPAIVKMGWGDNPVASKILNDYLRHFEIQKVN